jgi:hypothetical protein
MTAPVRKAYGVEPPAAWKNDSSSERLILFPAPKKPKIGDESGLTLIEMFLSALALLALGSGLAMLTMFNSFLQSSHLW